MDDFLEMIFGGGIIFLICCGISKFIKNKKKKIENEKEAIRYLRQKRLEDDIKLLKKEEKENFVNFLTKEGYNEEDINRIIDIYNNGLDEGENKRRKEILSKKCYI